MKNRSRERNALSRAYMVNVMVLGNQHKILIGLVLFLVVLLMYRVLNPYRQETVARLTYGRTTKITPSAPKTAYGRNAQRPTTVMTALFTNPPRVVAKTNRDPFRKAAQPAPVRASQPVNPKPPPAAKPSALDQAKKRLGRFKVFGSFRQKERKSLFLQRGKQVLVITEGDRIDGKFKIESIDGNTAVVSTSDLDTPFEFEFEELDTADIGAGGLPSSTPGRAIPRRRSVPAPAPREPSGSTPPENFGASSPPPLPKPPPTDSPAPPPSSKGSPSRSYLPGNKPQEDN